MLCPLTLDYSAFQQSLEAVDTEIIPRKGTDLASAIREAERTFNEAGNNFKILVVITDGEDLQGEALAAAKDAAKNGMVIHTVGIGSSNGELIPIAQRGGGTEYLRDAQGEPVRSKLDEAGLRAISEATDGIYAPFGQHAEGLSTIYREKLSLIPKGEISQRTQQVPIERFQWPLVAAIVLLLFEFLVSDRRRSVKRVRKAVPVAAPGKGVTAAIAIGALCAVSLAPSARAEDARSTYNAGIAAYDNGDLESAAASFEGAIEGSSALGLQAQSYYNLGNTLFKSGAAKLAAGDSQAVIAEWEESLSAFDGALSLTPDDADAKHNRDLVQGKLDELKQQQEQEEQEQQQDEQQQQDDQQSQDDHSHRMTSNRRKDDQIAGRVRRRRPVTGRPTELWR